MLLEDLCLPRPSRVGESEERNNHCHLEEMDEQDFEKFVKAATTWLHWKLLVRLCVKAF